MQKISLFQVFILEINSVLESRKQMDHTHFSPFPSKILLIKIFFFELVSTCKKLGYFTDLFRRFRSFRNAAIWLSESFGPYLRNKIFTKHRLCTETQQIIQALEQITEQIQLKSKVDFFNKFKKPDFWPHFDPFSLC